LPAISSLFILEALQKTFSSNLLHGWAYHGIDVHPRSWMTRNRGHYGTILHLRSFVKSEKRKKDSSMTKAFFRS
jgi:hypothetical protein